jgi:hypothetical protein
MAGWRSGYTYPIPEPLLHLQKLFGGQIYGPYLHSGRHYRSWHLTGDALYDALPVIFRFLPDSRKRRQLEAWAQSYGFTCRRRSVALIDAPPNFPLPNGVA